MVLSKITLILTFLACLDSISARVCLSTPYITSIYNISFEPSKSYYNFTFIFESNYDSTKMFIVQNVILDKSKLEVDPKNHDPFINVTYLTPANKDDIVYSRYLLNNEPFRLDKSTHDAFVNSKFKELNLANTTHKAKDLMSACKSLAISNRPQLSTGLNSTHIQKVQYSGFFRCEFLETEGKAIRDPKRITQLRPTIHRNIISSFYSPPFLFEFTASGELLLYKFEKGQEISELMPLGDPKVKPKIFKLAGTFSLDSTKDMLFESEYCLKKKPPGRNIAELGFEMPYNSFTILKHNSYAVFLSNPVSEKFSSFFVYHGIRSISPVSFADEINFQSETTSFARFEESNPRWHHAAVVVDKNATQVGYFDESKTGEFEGIFLTQEHLVKLSPVMVVPNDITHWTSCKKIISFYGSLYTMHNYDENILDTASKWNILPLEHFPYPIEAVHAEGDEFWFFVKLSSVLVFTVDSRYCSELVFTRKKVIHNSQLLGNISPYVILEGRYYDGSQWNPSWDWLPDNNSWINIGTTSSRTWIYILVFVAVSVIVSLLVLSAVLTKNSKEEVYTIKSPRLVRSIRSPLQSQATPPKPSEMVLFGEQSSLKSIKSRDRQKKSSRRRRGSKSPSRTRRSYTLNHKVV